MICGMIGDCPTRLPRIVLLAVGLTAGSALAHEGATGVVADRMAAMQNMDLTLKAIQAMLAGWAGFDLPTMRKYAASLHDNCHQSEGLFTARDQDPRSRAKPAVWDNPEAFRETYKKLHEASEELVATAAGGDRADIAVVVSDLQRTCDGCHATFRNPD
jgi:cytochrome c556